MALFNPEQGTGGDGPLTTYPNPLGNINDMTVQGGNPTTGAGNPGNSSSGVMDFIGKLFPGISGAGGLGGINPNMISLLATALNQYNDSGKYMDLATKYADQMNPFGKERAYYQDRLHQLTDDPNAYLAKSPDYQAALKGGLGALDSSMSAKGFAGSGHAADEAQNFGSQLAAQYLDRDRQSLMQMAGSNIGPAAAAALISQGMKGSIDSQNQALSNLFRAFTAPGSKKPGGGGSDGGGQGSGGPLGSAAAGAIAEALKSGDWKKLFSISKTPVSDAFKYFKSIGYSDDQAQQAVIRTGLPQDDAFSRDSGGYAPGEPGYDTGGSSPWNGNAGDFTSGDEGSFWQGSFSQPIESIGWDNVSDLGFLDP